MALLSHRSIIPLCLRRRSSSPSNGGTWESLARRLFPATRIIGWNLKGAPFVVGRVLQDGVPYVG